MLPQRIRLGLAELVALASLLAVAGLLALAFLDEWTIALVPGLTYALAIIMSYMLYQQYVRERAKVSQPVALPARFRVVDTRGVCPLGRQKGDLITVGPTGSVAPQVCPAAQAVLHLAVVGGEEKVGEWCCPIYDHLLVFRPELKAA